MFRNPVTDVIVVVIIVLLFFGPKRLPMLSRSIGESIKEFKGGINDASDNKSELRADSSAHEAEHSASESKTA